MNDQITSMESWSNQSQTDKKYCRDCKLGWYMIYDSDHTKTSRCGRCGELEEQAQPAKQAPAARRRTVKTKEKTNG